MGLGRRDVFIRITCLVFDMKSKKSSKVEESKSHEEQRGGAWVHLTDCLCHTPIFGKH